MECLIEEMECHRQTGNVNDFEHAKVMIMNVLNEIERHEKVTLDGVMWEQAVSNFDLANGLIITKCGSEVGLGAQHCGSFPHQKQAGETVLSLTNGLRGFGKEFEETLSQKGFLKNHSPLNPNL